MEQNGQNIYTKKGDRGTTSLKTGSVVSKADDRIQLLGTIDELTSHLGVVKAETKCEQMFGQIERIQNNLITVMAGIADSFVSNYKLDEQEVTDLEQEIDRIENSFPREHKFVLPGGCRRSAQLDVARTVARRAERCMALVSRHHSIDGVSKQYLNRISDYLYISARYLDYEKGAKKDMNENEIVDLVMAQIKGCERISLDAAKKLIDLVERYSDELGRKSVISVCGPDGNMIAVHAMDDAFLASFDISMKKAYTSVAVKMSTMELSKLAQPGQTFYGVENTDGGRIVIFGGGVPLRVNGKIIGGLGVSGGTGEEDHELAQYGLTHLAEVL